MKDYPHINNPPDLNDSSLCFSAKFDGSNIRAEWSRKKSFYKFGKRAGLIGEDEPILGESISLIRAYEDKFSAIIKDQRWEKVVLFFEFYGPNSFAGWHDKDEAHQITLIDANVHKRGLIPPGEFIKAFGDLEITAPIIYRGKINQEIITQIRAGEFPGASFEGIVAKSNTNPGKMFKIKNQAWIAKLKERCQDNEQLFKELV